MRRLSAQIQCSTNPVLSSQTLWVTVSVLGLQLLFTAFTQQISKKKQGFVPVLARHPGKYSCMLGRLSTINTGAEQLKLSFGTEWLIMCKY